MTATRWEDHARLAGTWVWLARAGWLVVATLMVGVSIAFVPVRWEQFLRLFEQDAATLAQWGWRAEIGAMFRTLVGLILLTSSAALGGFVFWRRSDNWVAMLTALMSVSVGALFNNLTAWVTIPPAWFFPVSIVRVGAPMLVFLATYLFPDGRWVMPGSRLFCALSVLVTLSWTVLPDSPFNIYNPAQYTSGVIVTAGMMLVGLIAQVYRFSQTRSPILQQQTKWIVFGWVFISIAFGFVYLPPVFFPELGQPGASRLLFNLFAEPVYQASLCVSFVTAAVSILRYRLYNIDVIVRRALVYSAMTTILLLVYWASVLVLQQLFRAFIGQTSELAIIISTLGLAALFQPLRRAVQDAIDRRFYRSKYDAAHVLAAFSTTARDEVDLDRLQSELLRAVDETMQPTYVSLWVKPRSE